jgi:RHS repeat-associated protein
MAASLRETVLCRYRYDPLDRLVGCAPSAEADIQRFYCKSRLATEIQGAVRRSVFQHEDQLLAQLRREDVKVETALLATDHQRSVLNVLEANRLHPLAYTPYGHRPVGNGLLSLLGFNGERPDPVTGHYLLGNGYRAFNPVLMRFNSPDSLSPFGEGGVNYYAYKDTVNSCDPSGHAPMHYMVLKAVNRFKSGLKSMKQQAASALANDDIQKARTLTGRNTREKNERISQLKKKNAELFDGSLISKREDLKILDDQNTNYKYLFSDKNELIIGKHTNYFPHTVLEPLVRNPRIIAAGHIGMRNGVVILTNRSGHYFLPGRIDRTQPVISFLESIGIKASRLRDEFSMGEIPTSYEP